MVFVSYPSLERPNGKVTHACYRLGGIGSSRQPAFFGITVTLYPLLIISRLIPGIRSSNCSIPVSTLALRPGFFGCSRRPVARSSVATNSFEPSARPVLYELFDIQQESCYSANRN